MSNKCRECFDIYLEHRYPIGSNECRLTSYRDLKYEHVVGVGVRWENREETLTVWSVARFIYLRMCILEGWQCSHILQCTGIVPPIMAVRRCSVSCHSPPPHGNRRCGPFHPNCYSIRTICTTTIFFYQVVEHLVRGLKYVRCEYVRYPWTSRGH